MLKNYFKIAIRNLKKNKTDSVISIGGLAIGIACCLLFVAFVQFEWSFDAFHKNEDRIYRIYTTGFNKVTNTQSKSSFTPMALASVIRENYPQALKVVRIDHPYIDVKINGKFVHQKEVYRVQPGFFEIFSFPIVEGNPKTALRNPNGILITKDKARQIFGTVHAIGEKIELRVGWDEYSYTVTGIMKNVPKNSSFQFDYILPWPSNKEHSKKNWRGKFQTIIMLKKHINGESFEKILQNSIANYAPESWIKSNTIKLQPLESIYLTPALSTRFEKSSNPLYSRILAGIAFIVLGIAAINFMSLTLSRASVRSNEVSVRKVVGASRGQLAGQFLGEAFLTCLLALLIGSAIANLILPWFQGLINRPVLLNFFYEPLMISIVLGILLVVILITGGYPAFILSRQKATVGFKPQTTSGKIPRLVKMLIAVQFALAIAFIASTLIMSNQMEYISNKDKGFNPENVIDIRLKASGISALQKAYKIYSQKVKQIPAVESFTGRYIPYGNYAIKGPSVSGDSTATLNVAIIDEHYLETMEIKLLAGHGFSQERPSELKHGILINKAAVEQWGWKQPINKKFNDRKVIGVIGNFHKKPLYKKIEPAIFRYGRGIWGLARLIRVKIVPGKMEPALKKLKSVWNETFPNETFDYSFLEDTVQQYYSTQRSWIRIMEFASIIAIILACFGLFGLTSLAAERRTKEIGIRKVMGASVANIVGLLSKDFLKLVLIGFVIAVPIAWYAMNQWLQDFAYRIDLGAGIFLLAGGLALLIALATVSWQSIRAALANPVDSLRSE